MRAPSHLRVLGRVALRSLHRGTSAEPSSGPRRRVALERDGIRVDPARLRRYLRATAGERIAAFRTPDPLLPPLFPAIWETSLVAEVLAEAGVPLLGLVHLESETLRPRPLHAGDRIRCRVELGRAEARPGETRLQLVARSWNAPHRLCAESTLVLRVPAAGTRAGSGSRDPTGEPPPDPGEWREVARWRLGAGRGWRYALASGDWNPIHLWGWTARPFGFRRPILHGFCTEALVAHALIEHRWGGDPNALRRLRIRFRAPFSLPGTATLRVAENNGSGGRFRMVGTEERLLAEGEFGGG